jgi:hypothetical protein
MSQRDWMMVFSSMLLQPEVRKQRAGFIEQSVECKV